MACFLRLFNAFVDESTYMSTFLNVFMRNTNIIKPRILLEFADFHNICNWFNVFIHVLTRTLFILLLSLCVQTAGALTSAPRLFRACLNYNDSIVTIEYSSISDACGSFVEHHIYGSETGTNYKHLYTESTFGANSISFKLPSISTTWSFYFETRFKCNGTDTAQSNTITVDSDPPSISPFDSISFDVATQQLIAGWRPNAAPDTKGYRIYKRENNTNSRIGDTVETSFIVDYQNFSSIGRYTLAVFDSCDLFSPISAAHKPMIMSLQLDSCTKTNSLSWTTYEGWAVDNQQIYRSINGGAFSPITTLGGVNQTYDDSDIQFGDSACYFVRARNAFGISSSSNVLCEKLNQPILPNVNYLSRVTNTGNKELSIEVYIENLGLTDSAVLYNTSTGSVVGNKQLSIGNAFYEWVDNSTDVASDISVYQVRTFAPCYGETSTSQTGNNIVLSIEEDVLTWNDYANWDGNVSEYLVYGYDGSTWNNLSSTSELSYRNTDTTQVCFYVEAVENQNIYDFSKTSRSNEACARREPRFYVPNALNPLSENHTFRVYGNSLDTENAVMNIYNRWGQQIFSTTDITTGWSVESNEVFIPLGIYLYDILLYDLNGNKHRLSGTVRVIR